MSSGDLISDSFFAALRPTQAPPVAFPPQYRQALTAAGEAVALLEAASMVAWVSTAADAMRSELGSATTLARSIQDAIGRAMQAAAVQRQQWYGAQQ